MRVLIVFPFYIACVLHLEMLRVQSLLRDRFRVSAAGTGIRFLSAALLDYLGYEFVNDARGSVSDFDFWVEPEDVDHTSFHHIHDCESQLSHILFEAQRHSLDSLKHRPRISSMQFKLNVEGLITFSLVNSFNYARHYRSCLPRLRALPISPQFFSEAGLCAFPIAFRDEDHQLIRLGHALSSIALVAPRSMP